MIICMIPARMGSQRLEKKNLRELGGISLIERAIRKSIAAKIFDEIWVNSEDLYFGEIASREGVGFHKRPKELGSNVATSEDYIAEFLERHECDFLVQVHSIAPLLTIEEILGFVEALKADSMDCLLSYESIQIECAFQGKPINFQFSEKTNSQELDIIQKISWAISGWRRSVFLRASKEGRCATYSGRLGFYPISFFANHVIKTERDLQIAEALLPLLNTN